MFDQKLAKFGSHYSIGTPKYYVNLKKSQEKWNILKFKFSMTTFTLFEHQHTQPHQMTPKIFKFAAQ